MVVDVTEDTEWMERARWLTAEGYVALADPKFGIGLEDVFNVVSSDVYEEAGRSKTFATLTTDPESGSVRISGTVRVVLGKESESEDEDVPPIDAIHFMNPVDHWPHKQNGWADSDISELGALFHSGPLQVTGNATCCVDVWITNLLYRAAETVVRQQGKRIFYAIMPPYVTRLLNRADIRMEPIESTLRTDNIAVAHVFEQFKLVLERSRPKLYHFPDAPLANATIPPVTGWYPHLLASRVSPFLKPNTTSLVEAIASWRQLLGSQHVELRRENIAEAEQATFQCERRILALISPGSTAEVRAAVKIATETGVLLYPISRGRNWGLGSKLPSADSCVLIDLSRMNRIIAYDEQLSYLTVEPGVTYAQAATYLRERNSEALSVRYRRTA